MNNICLASCFLPLDETNSRWWKQFQDELARCGMELLLLSSAPAAEPQLRTILVPLFAKHYADVYAVTTESITLEPALTDALARRDRTWVEKETGSLSDFRKGLSACQYVLRGILNELQPAVVLVWGNSLPQSVVLQQLALQQGRPCWMIERGLLPGTFMIDMSGQSGQCELNWSYSLNRALRQSQATDLFYAAQAEILGTHQSKYAQAEYLAPDAFHQRYNPRRRKLIAFTLQHDVASCLSPADFKGAGIHAPGFRSSEQAIRALDIAARANDALVIVKPHPIDHSDYSKLENDHVRVCRDLNLHSLIAASDVVACLTSTTQFEALLHEKPVLLMARSQLAGKGAAYEALTPEALPEALRAALNRDGFAARMTAARRFLHFVLKNYSIAIKDGAPAGSTLKDLAQFLRGNALHQADAPSSEAGIAALQRCFDSWTKPATSAAAAPKNNRQPASNHVLEALAKSPDTLKQIGSTLCSQGAWSEAGQIYQTLTRKLPDDFDGWHGRIECARKQGHEVMARLLLEEALEKHPEWAQQLNAGTQTVTAPLGAK